VSFALGSLLGFASQVCEDTEKEAASVYLPAACSEATPNRAGDDAGAQPRSATTGIPRSVTGPNWSATGTTIRPIAQDRIVRESGNSTASSNAYSKTAISVDLVLRNK
jgi:hypothetical protein